MTSIMENSQQVPPLHTISRVAKKLSRHERAWLGTCSGSAFRSGWHISRGLQILFLRTFSTSTSRSMRLATSDASFPLVLGLWVFLWSAVVIFGEVCQFIERKRKKKFSHLRRSRLVSRELDSRTVKRTNSEYSKDSRTFIRHEIELPAPAY